MTTLQECSLLGKVASQQARNLTSVQKNSVLLEFAQLLLKNKEMILNENQKDLEQANDLSNSMKDRLTLNEERLAAMALGVRQVANLEDPVGRILEERDLENHLHLTKVSVPFGVIGIIFEARPNVSADCSALCLKAGSACILKGGKEAKYSCKAIVSCMQEALTKYDLDPNIVQLVTDKSHQEVQEWIEERNSLDLLIPRGSKKLIQSVVLHAKVPVIETGAGICHTYVDDQANIDMAVNIIENAKCSHPSVCNAMETLLIHKKVAQELLLALSPRLQKYGVVIHGDEMTKQILPEVVLASNQSYATEYNDFEMNCKIVNNVQEACEHIEKYGTHHSDCIVTEDENHVQFFMNHCDSACVYHNASTRFTDGFKFGLGAEIGISTQKLHARGPMGLKELTTYSYQIRGKGEIR